MLQEQAGEPETARKLTIVPVALSGTSGPRNLRTAPAKSIQKGLGATSGYPWFASGRRCGAPLYFKSFSALAAWRCGDITTYVVPAAGARGELSAGSCPRSSSGWYGAASRL